MEQRSETVSSTRLIKKRQTKILGALFALALVLAGCSSSDSSSQDSTTTTAAQAPLKILVTNDDGFDSDGIDAIVEALRAQPNVEITVVAPATNQSGKGGTVTGGTLTATDGKTKSGYPVKAVVGTPADAIVWAIDQKGISFTPDFVVSGINAGQNMGSVIDLSGTVGAARAATQRGIPAIAASQGITDGKYDFPSGVQQVMAWFTENRPRIADKSIGTATVTNMNIPTCATGSVRGPKTVPVAPTADGFLNPPNCLSTMTDPTNDIMAFQNGFAAISLISPRPAA